MDAAFLTTWWVWIVAGFALGVLEVLAPAFIFLGFAIGAVLTGVLVGVLVGTGLLGANSALILFTFAILSLLSWLVLRRVVGVRPGQVKLWDRDINDT